jgi:hypothetical protein
MEKFKVISEGLNLRSSNIIDPDNIVSVLTKGQIVTRIGNESNSERFWRVNAEIGSDVLTGFVSHSFISLVEKVLWVVEYDDLNWFLNKAVKINATAVAIRTSASDLEKAIPAFHDKDIKVYGWRWPVAKEIDDKTTRKLGTKEESARVVALIEKGLDGYYADPEGSEKSNNWNKAGLENIARDFCITISQKLNGKPFGTTSHFRGVDLFDELPWKVFFEYSTVFLPQAYWNTADGTVAGGDPSKNYLESLDCWERTGAPRNKIVPMAGELAFSSPKQIDEYAEEAANQGITSLHFYTANKNVNDNVWKAIAKAGES